MHVSRTTYYGHAGKLHEYPRGGILEILKAYNPPFESNWDAPKWLKFYEAAPRFSRASDTAFLKYTDAVCPTKRNTRKTRKHT